MREVTIVIEKKLYQYSELSEQAKEKVKEWYLEEQENSVFTEMCEERLNALFPNSELKVQYSLGYCQGDGFNIYGKLNIDDAIKALKLSDEDEESIKEANHGGDYAIVLEHNNKYCYSLKSHENISDIVDCLIDIEIEFEDDCFKKYQLILEVFVKKVMEYMAKLDKEFEGDGYNYFYEVDEEMLKEVCESNGYEFEEDGTYYYE